VTVDRDYVIAEAQMGNFMTIEHGYSAITLSMVKWGILRKTAMSIRRTDSHGTPVAFVPQCEIAIYNGPAKAVLSKKPVYVFYFADEKFALEKWDELVKLVRHSGLIGEIVDFISNADPQKQCVWANLPSAEELARWPRPKNATTPTAQQGPSDSDLRSLALRGDVAAAILQALVRDAREPLQALGLETHLTHAQLRHQASRDVVRYGYQMRMAEQRIMGPRLLVAQGQVHEILHSNKSPQEKTEAIAEYFEDHMHVGLGDPIRPYVLARFDEIRETCELFVSGYKIPEDDVAGNELYRRLFADGYVYRVAEELVQGLSATPMADTKNDESADKNDEVHWEMFYGQPNRRALLEEKAKIVTRMIIEVCDTGPWVATALENAHFELPALRLGDEEVRQAYAETAALLLSLVDRIAFRVLGSEKRDIFFDALEAGVTGALQDKGVEPRSFQTLLGKRYEEYSHYQKLVSGPDEGAKGTLMWEFGKKVAAILGIGPNAIFQTQLSLHLGKQLKSWNLNELLVGSPK
jgi:hypothetical protein